MEQSIIRRAIRQAVIAFTGLRLWTIIILFIASLTMPGRLRSIFPFVESTARALERDTGSLLFLAPWYRYDTVHYLEIAQGGYSYPSLTTWAPVYPLLIHCLSILGLAPMLAALIISSAACLLALFLVYLLVYQFGGIRLADRTLLVIILFPTSFFLVAGYTEPLFILLSIAFFLLLYRHNWFWAGVIGSIATLTRFQGVALILPAAWIVWQSLDKHSPTNWFNLLIKRESPLWAVSLPPLSFIGWNCWVHYGLNYPWPIETLGKLWGQHTGFPWEGIIGNFSSLLGLRIIEHNPISPVAQIYDLFLVILTVTLLIMVIAKTRQIPAPLQLFTWINLLIILVKVDNNWLLISASRYLLSAFPLFIAIALRFTRKWIWLTWILFSFFSQIFLLLCFYNWVWVP
jgi:hypothetical protein